MQHNIGMSEQILLRHKIYGRNESLEGLMSEIDYTSKSASFKYKSIMPVDSSVISKMNTTPFLVEIWKKTKADSVLFSPSSSEEFLGLIRINLKTIPELLSNPSAFASNLFPTMLVDGEMPIWDPSSNINIGIAHLTLGFGTVSQVHLYTNKIAAPISALTQSNQQ